MRQASPTAVIPTQVGTHARFCAHDGGVEMLRPAASAVVLAYGAPVAACMDPGLRRDDEAIGCFASVPAFGSTSDMRAFGTTWDARASGTTWDARASGTTWDVPAFGSTSDMRASGTTEASR